MLTAIVFDFGEVLLRTGPKFLYRKMFADSDEMNIFLNTILTKDLRSSWNAGARVQEELERMAAKHPRYENELRAFYTRFIETVDGPIDGMPELVRELKQTGLPLFGLTNWAADTFPFVPDTYPFLRLLDDVIVSGDVGMKKPNPAIFELAIRRFGLDPTTTLFIDDKQGNIDAARQVGLQAVRFQDAPHVREVIDSLRVSASP